MHRALESHFSDEIQLGIYLALGFHIGSKILIDITPSGINEALIQYEKITSKLYWCEWSLSC